MNLLDPWAIRKKLGRDRWSRPFVVIRGQWAFKSLNDKGSVIVSCGPFDDTEWIHASISWTERTPSYGDLKMLHKAVFNDGYAYQIFAPEKDHVNIHANALHLFGRLDGAPHLPEFMAVVNGVKTI